MPKRYQPATSEAGQKKKRVKVARSRRVQSEYMRIYKHHPLHALSLYRDFTKRTTTRAAEPVHALYEGAVNIPRSSRPARTATTKGKEKAAAIARNEATDGNDSDTSLFRPPSDESDHDDPAEDEEDAASVDISDNGESFRALLDVASKSSKAPIDSMLGPSQSLGDAVSGPSQALTDAAAPVAKTPKKNKSTTRFGKPAMIAFLKAAKELYGREELRRWGAGASVAAAEASVVAAEHNR
ncbi:hypothetical protein BOTBODRAFT_409827 [Botryobasidium botryosum FD-172 SS1]|uniref:Uncharacterized protein n=1 Tax=Botryobasidium botryosum (strain FD-172 SS1) TaxID=930990 RepID=A0A067MAZ9_BOTB1|nr:hypothetical protein BOTBODRAFT_409827 [Botryobasidium botryosum FD-172 SS1]